MCNDNGDDDLLPSLPPFVMILQRGYHSHRLDRCSGTVQRRVPTAVMHHHSWSYHHQSSSSYHHHRSWSYHHHTIISSSLFMIISLSGIVIIIIIIIIMFTQICLSVQKGQRGLSGQVCRPSPLEPLSSDDPLLYLISSHDPLLYLISSHDPLLYLISSHDPLLCYAMLSQSVRWHDVVQGLLCVSGTATWDERALPGKVPYCKVVVVAHSSLFTVDAASVVCPLTERYYHCWRFLCGLSLHHAPTSPLQDVDFVWFRDPMEYFHSFLQADLGNLLSQPSPNWCCRGDYSSLTSSLLLASLL